MDRCCFVWKWPRQVAAIQSFLMNLSSQHSYLICWPTQRSDLFSFYRRGAGAPYFFWSFLNGVTQPHCSSLVHTPKCVHSHCYCPSIVHRLCVSTLCVSAQPESTCLQRLGAIGGDRDSEQRLNVRKNSNFLPFLENVDFFSSKFSLFSLILYF